MLAKPSVLASSRGSFLPPISSLMQAIEPGAEFEVCIVRTFHAPGVPSILDSRRNTVRARFVVHLDQLRGVR